MRKRMKNEDDVSTLLTTPAVPPAWVVKLMPPGYENRLAEIQRLVAELRAMDRFSSLLLDTGPGLEAAVRDLFAGMKFDLDAVPTAATSQVPVKLDTKRRLLLCVADTGGTLEKKDPALEHAFKLLTQVARPEDRVGLVVQGDTTLPPGERPDPVAPDALALLERLGVNVLTGAVLFALWSLSLHDQVRARAAVDKIHAHNGGLCPAPSPAPRP